MEESLIPGLPESTQPTEPEHDEEFWRDHVGNAKTFPGTARHYCKENGLSFPQFKAFKKKFALEALIPKPKPKGKKYRRRRAFIRIKADPTAEKSPVPRSSYRREPTLPDPKWVAEFIAALTGLL
jgi:hypothetical protein